MFFEVPQSPVQPEQIPVDPEPDGHDDEHDDVELMLR
jgi:hypothetical protein